MTVTTLVPPAVAVLPLAAAKAHLRIAHTTEDELIEALVRAATAYVERVTGLALITRTLRLHLDASGRDGAVTLPVAPVRNLETVTLYARDGAPHILSPDRISLRPHREPPLVHLDLAGLDAANGIEIDFVAGHGETGQDVPDTLIQAIRQLVAHWYEFRGAFGADDQPVSVPDAVSRLLQAHRAMRL